MYFVYKFQLTLIQFRANLGLILLHPQQSPGQNLGCHVHHVLQEKAAKTKPVLVVFSDV